MRVYFDLPAYAANARALGYACGLMTGMATPDRPLQEMPEKSVMDLGMTVTSNDFPQFTALFRQGVEAGLIFGREASSGLVEVLAAFPEQLWWPICMFYSSDHMHVTERGEPHPEEERIQEGVEAFHYVNQQRMSQLN